MVSGVVVVGGGKGRGDGTFDAAFSWEGMGMGLRLWSLGGWWLGNFGCRIILGGVCGDKGLWVMKPCQDFLGFSSGRNERDGKYVCNLILSMVQNGYMGGPNNKSLECSTSLPHSA